MVVAHNLLAMNAQRQFGVVTSDNKKSTEKLSSGYKINRAADDAAGLTISEKLRSQIRGLTQASSNCQDGVSFIQIADGALEEVHSMLDRMVELTVKASNGTNTDEDRAAIQKEISELTSEINRVHESSEFNTIKTFSDNGHSPDEDLNVAPIAALMAGEIDINSFVGAGGAVENVNGTSNAGDNSFPASYSGFVDFVKDSSNNAVNKLQSTYPELFKASSSNIGIGLTLKNDAVGGTLAYASLTMVSGGGSTGMQYTMNIDTADYDPTKYASMTAEEKADLSAVIAHEMTHLVMYDTLSSKMSGGDRFPKWFIEGMAQTASGDNGWVSYQISPTSTDAEKKNYMSQIVSMPYGAGYMGTMALGLEIERTTNPSATATSANIKSGLNKLFEEMVNQQKAGNGIDADAAINTVTGGKYTSFSDFADKFRAASPDLYKAFDDILQARGTTGGGSLLDDLNKSELDVFGTLNAAIPASYKLDPDHTGVMNSFGAAALPSVPLAGGGVGGGGSADNGEDIIIQAGAANRTEQQIALKRFDMSATAIFGSGMVNCSTQDLAKKSIATVNEGIARVSKVRSYYGAMQNRLEHTIKNLDNIVENTTAAESQIRDTDMASEMVKYTKNNILMQAGQAMMAQANQSTQGVLSLLQ